jgi:hypothetical protein
MQYVSVEHQKAIAPLYKQASIIVMAFALSVILFLILGKVATPGEPAPGSEQWQKMIYAGVLILGLFIVVLRRFLLSGIVINRAAAGGIGNVLRNLMAVTIIIASLAEAIAIIGLVFYFVTADYQYSWRLGVISLFLLAYGFPRRAEWERIVAKSTENAKAMRGNT